MTLTEIVTFSKLSYYDGKLKAYISGLLSGKTDKVTSAVSGNFAGLDENGNLTDSGKKAADFQPAGSYKTTQTAVADPSASGNAISFIDSISQDTNGVITPTKKTIPAASPYVDAQTPGNAGLLSAADKATIDNLSTNLGAKADKVTGATNGNFAGLDANGNLTDSGKKAADFADASHVHGNISNDGKMTDTAAAAGAGDKLILAASADGTVKRSTIAFDGSDTTKALTPKGTFETFLQSHQDITGKADKVSGATADNFAGLDANGNLKDSGKSASDFATATQGGYADSALQSVSNGTDGSYVTTTIGSKSGSAGAKDQTIGVAVTVQPMSTAGVSNMGLAEASDVKSYIDNKVAAGINYKGGVEYYSDLPANPSVGDMYNVEKDEGTPGQSGYHPGDMNYIWAAASGTQGDPDYVAAHWDPQAPIIVVTECTTAQIDTLFPAS